MWATDITYIPMARGFLYLVAIMDWLSNTHFCVAALEEALSNTQTVHQRVTSMLLAQGLSMDGRGRCMDKSWNGCGAASSTRRCT